MDRPLSGLDKRTLRLCYARLTRACVELARMHDLDGNQTAAENYRAEARSWQAKRKALWS